MTTYDEHFDRESLSSVSCAGAVHAMTSSILRCDNDNAEFVGAKRMKKLWRNSREAATVSAGQVTRDASGFWEGMALTRH